MNLLLLREDERRLPTRDARAQHILRVLKLGPGGTLNAGVVNGPMGTATITAIDSDGISLNVEFSTPPPRLPPIELLLGHPRPIVLKRLLKDLSAIGLAKISVVPTELGEKSYYGSRMWEQVDQLLIEGAAQAGATRLPMLRRYTSLQVALEQLSAPPPGRLVPHPGGARSREVNLHTALAERPAGPLAVAIGSERGWTESELRTLEEEGFQRVSLGPRILRTETAASLAVWTAAEHFREGVSGA